MVMGSEFIGWKYGPQAWKDGWWMTLLITWTMVMMEMDGEDG